MNTGSVKRPDHEQIVNLAAQPSAASSFRGVGMPPATSPHCLAAPSVALLVAAQAWALMPVLLAGTTVTGISIAMGYRGNLQVINEIASGDKRAEVISSFLIVCFAGNAVPVVAVGILAATFTPMIATVCLAAMISVLALIALGVEMRVRPQSEAPAG